MVFLPVQSGLINGTLFVVVDILALWAIHRGLLCLQGLHYYKLAIRGRRLPLARSRVPIVAGELLRGLSPVPSVYVFLNATVIVLAFFAAFGVNGQIESLQRSVPMQHLVRPIFHSKLYNTTPTNSTDWIISVKSCTRQTASTIEYWPVAFNTTARTIDWNTVRCLQDSPSFKPLLNVSCIVPPGQPNCWLSQAYRNNGNYNIIVVIASTIKPLGFFTIQRIITRQDTGIDFPAAGDVVVTNGHSLRAHTSSEGDCVVYRRANQTTHSYLSSCRYGGPFNTSEHTNRFTLFLYTPIITMNSHSDENTYSSILRYLDMDIWQVSKQTLLERYIPLVIALGPAGNQVRENYSISGTDISTFSLVSIAILVISAILLLPVKCLIYLIMFRKGTCLPNEVFCNDYNILSKHLCMEMKKKHTEEYVDQSHSYPNLASFVDDNDQLRVGPRVE